MDDLAAWLSAQLDADERIARAATQGEWVWSREFVTPPGYHHRTIGPLEPGDAAFIAAHDPSRVLREIDGKRRTIAEYEKATRKRAEHVPNSPAYRHWDNRAHGLYLALRFAAAVYEDRPGYAEAIASMA